MDYHTFIDHWEEEIHGIDGNMCCNLLWTVIPLSGQVSVKYFIHQYIVASSSRYCQHQYNIIVASSLMTCIQSYSATIFEISDLEILMYCTLEIIQQKVFH